MQYPPLLKIAHQKDVVEMEIASEVRTHLEMHGPATIGMIRNATNRGYHAIVKALNQLRADNQVWALSQSISQYQVFPLEK